MRERGELPMEHQNLNQEQKLRVALCGPLPKTERALLQRGDVEIKRGSSLNLMGEMVNEIYDCDMIIVQAPYGHGLYSMTYPVREEKKCPAWMVADPPDETVWKEINWQLDHTHEKNRQLAEQALRMGPPRNEAVILAGEAQLRSDLTGWMRDICAGWGLAPELTAPGCKSLSAGTALPRPTGRAAGAGGGCAAGGGRPQHHRSDSEGLS